MPLPPEAEQSLREIRLWEQDHPGYCGRCSLPFRHCYHGDPNYRAEVRAEMRNQGPRGLFSTASEWHARALKGLATEDLVSLPEPRQAGKKDALIAELRERGRQREAPRVPEKSGATRYQRLMRDDT